MKSMNQQKRISIIEYNKECNFTFLKEDRKDKILMTKSYFIGVKQNRVYIYKKISLDLVKIIDIN